MDWLEEAGSAWPRIATAFERRYPARSCRTPCERSANRPSATSKPIVRANSTTRSTQSGTRRGAVSSAGVGRASPCAGGVTECFAEREVFEEVSRSSFAHAVRYLERFNRFRQRHRPERVFHVRPSNKLAVHRHDALGLRVLGEPRRRDDTHKSNSAASLGAKSTFDSINLQDRSASYRRSQASGPCSTSAAKPSSSLRYEVQNPSTIARPRPRAPSGGGQTGTSIGRRMLVLIGIGSLARSDVPMTEVGEARVPRRQFLGMQHRPAGFPSCTRAPPMGRPQHRP